MIKMTFPNSDMFPTLILDTEGLADDYPKKVLNTLLYFVILFFSNPLFICASDSITFNPFDENTYTCSSYSENAAIGEYGEYYTSTVFREDFLWDSAYSGEGGIMSPEDRDGYLDIIFTLPSEYDYSDAEFYICLYGKGNTDYHEDNISVSVMKNSSDYFLNQCSYFENYVLGDGGINDDDFYNIMDDRDVDEEGSYNSEVNFYSSHVGQWQTSSQKSVYVRVKVDGSDEVDLKFVALVWSGETLNLDEALDNSSLTFYTSSWSEWLGQKDDFFYDGDAARSGDIGDNEYTEISTEVEGPGFLSFYWKVSSEANYDGLHFWLDGESIPRASISGETDWQKKYLKFHPVQKALDGNILKIVVTQVPMTVVG